MIKKLNNLIVLFINLFTYKLIIKFKVLNIKILYFNYFLLYFINTLKILFFIILKLKNKYNNSYINKKKIRIEIQYILLIFIIS